MQSYQDIPDTTTLTASRSLLLNNILTALSQSSGTAFPTTNLVLGMPCYRSDLNKSYILTNLTGPVWTLEQDYARTAAYLDDNIASATKLQTARTISLSGDISGSASFDGTANAAITATLPNTGVTAGTYSAATITVNAKGQITSASASTLVSSFQGRTGAVTLASSDVTGALGYTPMNSSNTTFGSVTVSSTANYIYMQDTDWGTRHLHHNGGLMGHLDSSGNWNVYDDNAGNIWSKAYGWLHGYFFSTTTNCADGWSNCAGNTGNCKPYAGSSLTQTVYNCGNANQNILVLRDDGSAISLVRQYANFNCNCNCDCC